MLRLFCRMLVFFILSALVGCSSTTLSGSWKSPEFHGKLDKIYIIGVAKNHTNRRIFEDEFGTQLMAQGVTGISSYADLNSPADADQNMVAERVRANGADSVLMTRMVDKRTEEVVTPARVTTYSSGPYAYAPAPYYRSWGSYYDRRYETIYEPATVTRYEVATMEANLYDAKTSELIWSAQLETVLDVNLPKLIDGFVKVVIKDLKQQGLL